MNRKQNEPYMSTYLHRRGNRLGLPISGSFELTGRCNFSCPMCYVHGEGDSRAAAGELSAENWLELASQARDMGLVFALLTGGEPFVREDFFEIYSGMKQMGLMLSVNSNGSLLKGRNLQRLLDDPPARMNISLYGGSGETYREMCGVDAYRSVVESIECLKNAGVDIRLNLSIGPWNRNDLELIYGKALELGVNIKAAAYLYPSVRVNGGKYGHCARLSPEQAAEESVKWDLLRFTPEEFAARAENYHSLYCPDAMDCAAEQEEGVGCRAGKSSFWLCWDGRMLPCGMMTGPEARPLESGFRAAWEHIRSETAKIRLPEDCAGCVNRSVCPVCAAVCLTETGGYEKKPEYMCRFTESFVKQLWEKHCERSEAGNGNKT